MITTHTHNVMIGPTKSGKGGISTVATQYCENGILSALQVDYWSSWVSGKPWQKLWAIISILGRLIYGRLRKRIRIIHVHSACRVSFFRKSIFVAVGHALGAPTIFHLHSGEFFQTYKDSGTLNRWWTRHTLNRCSAIVLLSERWRADMSQLIDAPHKIHIIHNPIDLNLPADYARKSRSADQLNLLFLGKIDENKGIFDLIPVVSVLRQKGLNIIVRCGGNGEIDRLTDAIREHQLGAAFQFLGWIDSQQKIKEFEATDVFILPSHYEGQPMAILEAMMASVPIISTTAGGIPDTITDGQEGFLVPPGDPIAMQALLERVYNDLHCGDDIVAKAKAKVEAMHDPQRVLMQLKRLYNAIDNNNL